MNEATKNTIISMITSLLLGGACATIGARLGLSHDQMVQFANAAAPVIFAAVVGIVAFIYKALPKSKESIVRGAAQIPDVHQIVTTPELAAKVPTQSEVLSTANVKVVAK